MRAAVAARLLAGLLLLLGPARSKPTTTVVRPVYFLACHASSDPVDTTFSAGAFGGNLLHIHAHPPFRGPGSKWLEVQRFVTANMGGGGNGRFNFETILVVADFDDFIVNLHAPTVFQARVRAAVATNRQIIFASEGCVRRRMRARARPMLLDISLTLIA